LCEGFGKGGAETGAGARRYRY